MDRDERVARRDHDRVCVGDRRQHAGRCSRLLGSLVDERVDLVLVASGDEPLLEDERAVRGDEVRAERIVGGRQQARGEARLADEGRRHRGERLAATERVRADEVKTEVEVTEHEPPLPAPGPCGLERPPGLAGTAPAALRVVQAREGVQHRVEVGRDVEAEDLEVVADVADDRQLARCEHVVEPGRELGAADSAREEHDLHERRALASARVRARARGATRARSDAVSTSARRFGSSRSCRTSPRAAAWARNCAALPGP